MTAKTLLAAAIAALLFASTAADAQRVSRETRPAADAPAEEDDRSDRKKKDDKSDELSYPNATREDPGKGKPKLQTKLTRMNKAFQSENYDDVIATAEEVLADPKATPFDRSQAAYFASFASVNMDLPDHKQAIGYAKRAIDENALGNEIHYQLMHQWAQMHLVDEQYAEALAVADRLVAETKSEKDGKVQALRGNALYRLDRYPEAIEALKVAVAAPDADKAAVTMLVDSYLQTEKYPEAINVAEGIANANPKDKKAALNLATVYAQADQPAKAAEVFERLRSAGMLTESSDYESGYRLLANLDGREKDTIAFINAGLEKGVLKPSASVYSVLGQSYYYSEQVEQAIAAWGKGAPLAKDGELYLNLAKVNLQEEHWAAAKTAAEQALAKGVRNPGEAWIVIAGAAAELGDRAGEIAAYREAAKDPKTRDDANRMLRSLGGK